MDQQPPEPDEQPGPPVDADEDEGILGEIAAEQPAEPGEERPEQTRARLRRRRSRIIGCLLALLGALAGGGLALWISRGAVIDLPNGEQVVAPEGDAAAGAPANRLVFSPTPERPRATPEIISAETQVIYCFYDMARLPADAALSATWSREGEPLGELPLTRHERDRQADYARGHFAIEPPANTHAADTSGFPPGIYEVELTSPDHPDVVAEASFVALPRAAQILQGGGEPEGPPVIRSLQTATGVSDSGEPIGQSNSFAADVGRISALFAYRGIAPGSVVTVRWHHGDEELAAARTEIAITAAEGWAEAWLETESGDALPAGQYRVSVHFGEEDEPLATTSFEVTSVADSESP